jgi:hypothetical protein
VRQESVIPRLGQWVCRIVILCPVLSSVILFSFIIALLLIRILNSLLHDMNLKADRRCPHCNEAFHRGSIARHLALPHMPCSSCGSLVVGKRNTHSCGLTRCCGRTWNTKSLSRHRKKQHSLCDECHQPWLVATLSHHTRSCGIGIAQSISGDCTNQIPLSHDAGDDPNV